MGELGALSKADLNTFKGFATRRVDTYRPSFAPSACDFPRQCVFAGTTNKTSYLRDETGARRFWPVECGHVRLTELASDRDQLWAEAVHLYKSGTKWHIDNATLAQLAATETDARFDSDPWETKVATYLMTRRSDVTGVLTCDVLWVALGIEPGRQTRGDEMRVSATLTRLGWAKGAQVRRAGARVRPFFYEVSPPTSTSSDSGCDGSKAVN